jgi:hypothetical protein
MKREVGSIISRWLHFFRTKAKGFMAGAGKKSLIFFAGAAIWMRGPAAGV